MTNQILAKLEILQQTKDKIQNDYQNAVDKINELQQENKQLKKKYENAVADYELEKYKNNKAIEYIKEYILPYFDESTHADFINLIEILGDKENDNICRQK